MPKPAYKKSKEQHLAEYNDLIARNTPKINAIDEERVYLYKRIKDIYIERKKHSQEIRTKRYYLERL